MPRTRVKICGICRPQDASSAARLGADAIGMVFANNAGRLVSIDDAAKIVEAVPPFVTTVGLFVNAATAEIRQVARTLSLDAVQLQGDEPPEFVAELKPIRVIKALHLAAGDKTLLARWKKAVVGLRLTNLIGILLETASGVSGSGGTGVLNDFFGLSDMQRAGDFSGLPPIIAAGGLTPANVGEVVRTLRPYSVDVSSGVESGKREKSAEKIEAFIRAVVEAEK